MSVLGCPCCGGYGALVDEPGYGDPCPLGCEEPSSFFRGEGLAIRVPVLVPLDRPYPEKEVLDTEFPLC